MKKNINLQQLTLPFSPGRTRALSYDNRVKAFWFLAGFCVFSLAAYIYAVNATARHVALRANLEREATELTTELATLEFQYIHLASGITIEKAAEYGFTEVSRPLYVARKGSDTLSFNSTKP